MRITYRADSVELEGYVVAFKRDSRPILDRVTGKYFYEQVLPGIFERELRTKEIPVLLDHMHDRKIGSSRTNFEFEEDPIGLKVKAVIPDPEVMKKAKEGKLSGWSFSFKDWTYKTEALSLDEMVGANGPTIRKKLRDMTLIEISLIDDRKLPCYEGTVVSVLDTQKNGSISDKSEGLKVSDEGLSWKKAYKSLIAKAYSEGISARELSAITESKNTDWKDAYLRLQTAYYKAAINRIEREGYKLRLKALEK